MAEVLTIRQIDVASPIGVRNGCVEIDGNIYINTPTQLYKYDIINKNFELLLNKGNNTTISVCTDGSNLYMIRYVSDKNGYLCRYDINNKTFNDSVKSITWQVKSGSHYTTRLYVYNNKIYITLTATTSSSNYAKNYTYDIITNTMSSGEYDTIKGGYGSETQFVDDLFFGYQDANNPDGIYKYIGNSRTNSNFGTYTEMPNTLTKGVFIHNNLYYIVYSTDIYTFNPNNNSLFKLNNTLPFSLGGSWVAGSNGDFYIFNSNKIINIKFVDYDLTYKIANKTGSEIYKELTGQSPITQVRFNYSGTGDVGYVFNTLSGTISGTYTPNIPSGYKLVGFGSAPNTKLALAGLNTDVSVSINENFTFYEIYQVYKPPATTFEMYLYQNTAENKRVDKTDYLTLVGSLFGALRTECSIIRPSIIIEQETLPTFNYVYIGAFSRYYFVTGITSVAYRMWRIELNTDVLMTYKNGITLLTAIIARQENDYNDNLIDAEVPTEKQQTITYEEIPNTVLNTQEESDNHCFVVTVVGA